jgi:hypothetical protein
MLGEVVMSIDSTCDKIRDDRIPLFMMKVYQSVHRGHGSAGFSKVHEGVIDIVYRY